MRVKLWMRVGREHWEKVVMLPFPPFAGLWIGAWQVWEVFVHQGTSQEIECRMRSANSTAGLESGGWKSMG